jgi:heat shock protein 4
LVSFDEKQRYAGESAQAVQMSNLKNTIGNIKQLLGRSWSDPKLQADLKILGVCNEFVELPGDQVGVKVTYRGEERVFGAEQLAGMLFTKLRQTTEGATQVKVKDVVVSVPGWFVESQRRALLDAVKLGGMEPLKLVNDLTAISLCWGLYKLELDEKVPIKVMFVDIGEQAMSVGITEFTKSQAKIVSTAYNTAVSGRAIDIALATHFADEFLAKRKVDLRQYPKSWFRLLSAVGKVKKILNTNPSAPLNVECIYEEFDINSVITRDVYADLVKGVVANVPTALDAALARIGVQASELHSIEVVGSASRTQLFQSAIAAHLGRDVSTTLNAEEAVAKGCALQCAILSPHFRVREYHLVDLVDHPIVCTWQTIHDPSDTHQRRVVIFDRASSWPAAKNVNFHRAECKPFEVQVHYETTGDQAVDTTKPLLATVTIEKVPKPADGPDADVRLKIRKNVHGLLEVAECELVEKYEEVAEAPSSAMDVDQKPAASPAADGAAPAQAEGAATPASPAATEAPAKKKKVRYTAIPFTVKYHTGQSAAMMAEYVKSETKIAEETRIAIAAQNAKNAVESYVYEARDKLYGAWAPYAPEADVAAFSALLDEAGDWLYGEGEDQPREVYESKLLSLTSLGDPIDFRLREHEARPSAIAAFERVHTEYLVKATAADEKYDHIPAEEKHKIVAEIEKNRAWFAPLRTKQDSSPLTADPIFQTKDLLARNDALAKLAEPILNKPKPKPKPVETPKPEEKPAPAAEPTPAHPDECMIADDPALQNGAPASEERMDVD